MEVLVREPPTFVTRPNAIYQHKIDDDVQMACEAQGTPSPRVTWRRVDFKVSLPESCYSFQKEKGNVALIFLSYFLSRLFFLFFFIWVD